MNRLTGIHAVREALEANRPLDSLIIAKGSHGNRIEELVRLARQHHGRPLLGGGTPAETLERLAVLRAAAYEAAAHVAIDTDGMGVDEVTSCVMQELASCTG